MSSISVVQRDRNGRATKFKARWRTPDGASRSRRFNKKIDAEQWLITVEGSKLTGGYVDRSAGGVTVEAFALRWIETRRSRDGAPLRPRTVALYRQLCATHIAPTLGRVKLRDVTPAAVRDWHASLAGAVAPAKAYRLLRAILSTAVDDGLIVRNPCSVKGAGVERSPERPLPTGDEVWQLADAIAPRYRCLVLSAAFVGLRWGELCGLRRCDIDLRSRVIHVSRSIVEVDGELREGPPKTAAGVRAVAMPSVVAVELERHLADYVGAEKDAAVFVGPQGATLRRANFNVIWNRARVTVGREDVHFHDLRHFSNTLAASAGASTREPMSRLGHASPAAALRYQHATAERDRVIAERMGEVAEGRTTRDGAALRVLRGG